MEKQLFSGRLGKATVLRAFARKAAVPVISIVAVSFLILEFWPHSPSEAMFHLIGIHTSPWPIVLVASLAIAIVAVSSHLIFPEIKYSAGHQEERLSKTSFEAVLRVLGPEESQVMQALKAAGGRALQRDLVTQTRLSKVKMHRIVARFSQKGLISVAKQGKTNQLELVDWLSK